MRIRSIRPEFWTSEDIAALDWSTRLVFIGLWSYVDDNGVGRDVPKLIVGSLFPLEEDTRDTLATVSRSLATLSDRGLISRYTVDGKPYLHVTTWDKHQRVDRAGKSRYPAPTCDDADTDDNDATVSRDLRETPALGEGEKGRRGEGEKTRARDADAAFDTWYGLYPKKVGRAAARKSWDKAVKTADADTILAGLQAQLPKLLGSEDRFRPNPATWLNQGRWDDEVPTQPTAAVGWWQQ